MPLRLVPTVLVALGLLTASVAQAQTPASARPLVCPVDGAEVRETGTDGRASPRMYSDLEVPTEAYPNYVVACAKCGYAAWTQDFERPVSGELSAWVKQYLAATARRAGSEPLYAWKHMLQILDHRQVSLRERLGATLFYTYVLKRRRPNGGQDHALEREILAGRKQVVGYLMQSLRDEPPKSARARLEWRYLVGELTRLIGEPAKGLPMLQEVCKSREEAGYTVGKLACEMADRAAKGDCWENYRDGMFDATAIPKPANPAEAPAAAAPAPDSAPDK
ncbi:MAG: hypothetical protein ACOYOB_13035 [Myxococcota bacterium]